MTGILYLDFDGVLHPDEVYLKNGVPTLCCDNDGLYLFCWAPLLESMLADYPAVQIRLSTSWVRVKSYDYALKCLPEGLRLRIKGATYHKRQDVLEFDYLTRFQQIKADAFRNGVARWIALDDDDYGWHIDFDERLIRCNGDFGLSEKAVQVRLTNRLDWLTREEY